jgi:protein gp37
MALQRRHQFQVLTKRPERIRDYLLARSVEDHLRAWAHAFAPGAMPISRSEANAWLSPDTTQEHRDLYRATSTKLPLANVLFGASVEDQVRADLRRGPMADIACAGWKTFVSYEPALGEVDWTGWEFLDWLIAGGESGPDARPMHPDWARIARDFCAENGILFFFKQWGEWAPGEANSFRKTLAVRGAHYDDDRWNFVRITPAEGAEMHVDDEPPVWRIGKRHSGRLLDGIEHNAMPEVA